MPGQRRADVDEEGGMAPRTRIGGRLRRRGGAEDAGVAEGPADRTVVARREDSAAADGAAVGEGRPSRRVAGRERTAMAVGSGVLALARLVSLIAAVVALIIAAAILFVVLGANHSNTIVSTVHDAGRSLVGPFDGMFSLKDPKATIALNWGIALVVYLVIGSIVASVLRRLAARGEAGAGRSAGPRAT